MGQGRSCDNGGIRNPDAMVDLIFFLQSSQDGYGIPHRRFPDEDRLKPPFQSGVFFDIFPILIEGRRPDASQCSPCQRGFEHVGGVHCAFCGSRTHKGMQLVDEKNHIPFRFFHLLDNRLQAVFEFSAILGARDQSTHVQSNQTPVFQGFRNITGFYSQGEALHDGGFADTGFSHEDRIVFGAAGKDLYDPPDLIIPTDDRIQLSESGEVCQITAEFFEGLVFFLGVRVGDTLGTPDIHQGL